MRISRKKFLGIVGGATAGVTLKGYARAAREFGGYPGSFGVLHDTTRCIGCRSCEAGCNKVNGLEAPERPFKDLSVLDKPRRTDYKTFTVVNKYEVEREAGPGERKSVTVFRKTQCNHCMEPACGSACFVSAFTKTPEGPVDYDPDLCVGCRYCMLSCPFYIPAYEYHDALDPRMTKCTMCLPRIREGKLPGCVESCPVEALTFGKREDLLKVARRRIRSRPGAYVDHIYGEHEMGGTSWLYLAGVPFEKLGLPKLGTKPHSEYTHSALAAVPIVVPLWLTFLTGIYSINKRKDAESRESEKDAVAGAVAAVRGEEERKAAAAQKRSQEEKTKAIEAAVKEAAVKQAKSQGGEGG
ncbi:MAG: sulfate respiration complex iron-sulfur protein HmcB [Elusimicrobiota bacterium]